MEPMQKENDAKIYNVPCHDLINGIADFYDNPALSDGEIHVDGKSSQLNLRA